MLASMLTLAAVLTVVGILLIAWQRRMPALHRRCLVSLVSDERRSVSGVLWQVRGPWLVLKDAALVQAGGERIPMDGDVVIDRRNVALVQAFPNGGEQLR